MLRTIRRTALIGALAAVAALTAATPASACGTNCVTHHQVFPHQASAFAQISTAVPTQVLVHPRVGSASPSVAAWHPSTGYATYHEYLLPQLRPNTEYGYTITVRDAAGRTFSFDPGRRFRTWHRRVTVEFGGTTLRDIGDSGQHYGENQLWFGVGSAGFRYASGSFSLATSLPGGVSRAQVDTPDDLAVAAYLNDEDSPFYRTCSGGTAAPADPARWTTGSTACLDWATARTTLPLRSAVAGIWYRGRLSTGSTSPAFDTDFVWRVQYFA